MDTSTEDDFMGRPGIIDSSSIIDIVLHLRPYDVIETEGCIRIIEGDILHIYSDFEPGEECGYIKAVYFDLELAYEIGMDPYNMFDLDGEWMEFFEVALDLDGEFKKGTIESLRSNIVLISRCGVYPEFRGHGIGLKAIQEVMLAFRSGCGMFVMKPFPLQLEGFERHEGKDKRLLLENFPQDENKSTKRLTNYYRKLGFKKIRGTPYLYLDTGYKYKIQEFIK